MRRKVEKLTRNKTNYLTVRSWTKAISLSTLESLETKKITMSSSNKQLKIAQIAPLMESVPPRLYGRTERIVSYLTEELVRLGHDVTLFASGDSVTRGKLISCTPLALRLRSNVSIQSPITCFMLVSTTCRWCQSPTPSDTRFRTLGRGARAFVSDRLARAVRLGHDRGHGMWHTSSCVPPGFHSRNHRPRRHGRPRGHDG